MAYGNANAVFQLSQTQINLNNKIGVDLKYEFGLIDSGWRWGNGSNVDGSVTQVINYHFAVSGPSDPVSTTWNNAQKAGTLAAMQQWEHVANIQFVETATFNNAEIVLFNTVQSALGDPDLGGRSGFAHWANLSGPTERGGTRVGDTGQVYTYFPGQDSKDFSTRSPNGWTQDSSAWNIIVHELGHALGLKHPHDNGSGGNFPNFPRVTNSMDTGMLGLSDVAHTIMSYVKPDPKYKAWADSPMAWDVAAIQLLYGANTNYNSGDTTYVVPEPTTKWGQPGKQFECIWDTGGTDQIVYNGTHNVYIDLRPATLKGNAGGGGYFSYSDKGSAYGAGYSIAGDILNVLPNVNGVEGVIIENARGGSGFDLLRGNDVENNLWGNAGRDTIYGMGGNDHLRGGAGKDYLIGGRGNDEYFLDDVVGGKYDGVDETINGGGDRDVVYVARLAGGPSSYTLPAGIEVGKITTPGNGFALYGNGLSNELVGFIGNDILRGYGGHDILNGGSGNDKLYGGVGNDALDGHYGFDTLTGGADNDTYYLYYVSSDRGNGTGPLEYSDVVEGANGGNDTVIVKKDNDAVPSYTLGRYVENGKIYDPLGNLGFHLIGNSLDNKLWGGRDSDILQGGDGNDEFYGNDDALNSGTDSDPHTYVMAPDVFYGGKGNDHYYLYEASLNYSEASYNGYSIIQEYAGEGTDTVHVMAAFNGSFLVTSYAMSEDVEIGRIESAVGFTLTGNSSANNLWGNSGNDELRGEGGADTLRGGAGYDVLAGGDGGDTYYLEDISITNSDGPTPEYSYDEIQELAESGGFDILYIKAVTDPNHPGSTLAYTLADNVETVIVTGTRGMTVKGSNVGISMSGSTGADNLTGGNGVNYIDGGAGDDTLTGGAYADTLLGRGGRDTLIGGEGGDTFVFSAASGTRPGAAHRDIIMDFSQGAFGPRDIIDLISIDADTHKAGNQAFHFIGTNEFSSDRRHHVYGELRYFQSPWSEGTNTIIEGDVNGDGKADFQIELYGPGSTGFILSMDDFRL